MIFEQSRISVLLVLVVVALAGCTGGGATDGGATTNDGTTTNGGATTDDGPAGTETTTAASGDGDDDVPEGTFDFSYDAAAGTLTITFLSGDNIAADSLRVQGENFGGNGGIWIELPGAEATLAVAGEQSLGVQDSVTIGAADGQNPVPSNYVVELAWVSDDGATTVIATNAGPDA